MKIEVTIVQIPEWLAVIITFEFVFRILTFKEDIYCIIV